MIRIKKAAICVCFILLFASCAEKGEQELLTIKVDMQSTTFPLSEITEEVREVELELTDNSLISRIRRAVWDEDYIIIVDLSNVLLFDNNGKFIRKIGSKGQGPGEYTYIRDLTVDFKNKHVYIATSGKILCYDFEGNYQNEYSNNVDLLYMNFINGELMIINESSEKGDEGKIRRSVLYKANKYSRIIDSIEIRKVVNPLITYSVLRADFILSDGKDINVYYRELNAEPSLRDTVFQIKDNTLVPDFRLDFQRSGMRSDGKRDLFLFNIWRSSRFIFSYYGTIENGEEYSHYCYDTEKQKGASMKGYYDDLHVGKDVNIFPMNLDSEQFYYTYTKESDALDEPNPTLYIGVLKK